MTHSSDTPRPTGDRGIPATEADAAGMSPSVAGGVSQALRHQPQETDDDAGLASTGEAFNAGQAPDVGAGKETIEPSLGSAGDPQGNAGR